MTVPAPRTGLVVGAGGPAGGAFIAAALDELRAVTGFDPREANIIIATSAGALVSAGLGTALPHSDGVARALRSLAGGGEWCPRRWDRAASALRRRAGLIAAVIAGGRGQPARYRVASGPYHPGLVVVTVDALAGERCVHHLATEQRPDDVVRASAAVPLVTRPVVTGGRPHLDGAVFSATNADLLDADSVDVAVVICAMVPRRGGTLLGRLDRAALRHELREHRAVVVVAPRPEDRVQRRDPSAFAESGRRAVRELLR